MNKPLNHLLTSAFVYTVLGLASGVFFREFTKATNFPDGGYTQLGLVHTHLLTLGFIMFLILLVLERVFTLSASQKLFAWFLWLYHAGVVLSATMMVVHGIISINGGSRTGMTAGMAGLGHMLLGAATVLMYFLIRAALKRGSRESAAASLTAAAPAPAPQSE